MRRWLSVFAIGCGSSTNPPRPPDRAADVLIAAPPELVVLYRDGDGDWQHAPRLGNDLLGFDLEANRYAIAAVDVASGNVTSRYTTLAEQPDVTFRRTQDGPMQTITGTVGGLSSIGARVIGPSSAVGVSRARSTYTLDVAQGVVTLVGLLLDDDRRPDSLIVRELGIGGPTALDLDFSTEGMPLTRTQAQSQMTCFQASRFSFGGTELELASATGRTIVMPHRDQWRAGDRLSILRQCSVERFVIDDLVSPDQDLPPFEQPPALEAVSVTVANDRAHVAWTAYESPVEYELGIAGPPCDPLETVGLFAAGGFCAHRWTVQVTEGWAAEGTELDVISRNELVALDAWSDSLELPQPVSWGFIAHRAGTDHRTRAFKTGTFE